MIAVGGIGPSDRIPGGFPHGATFGANTHGDVVTRGDVTIGDDGLVEGQGRWADDATGRRPGFEVFLESALEPEASVARSEQATSPLEVAPSGRARQEILSGRGSTAAGPIAQLGLGASVFRAATGSDIPGLSDLGVTTMSSPLAPRPSGQPISAEMAEQRAAWRPMFVDAANRHGIDPELLLAVAQVESSFDTSAVSPAGAQGLMQFMPATAAEMGVDPFEPASAIDGAARYLAREMDRFGRADLAVAAYNAGAGAVRRHGGVPPFAETQQYVHKVFNAWGAQR